MINRLAASLAAATIATLGFATAAQAEGYEPSPEEWQQVENGGDNNTVKEEAAVGKTFVFKAGGFAPNSKVYISWKFGSTAGAGANYDGSVNSMTTTADAQGNISVEIPAVKAGSYYMVAKGTNAAGSAVQVTGIGVAKEGSTGTGTVNGGTAGGSGSGSSSGSTSGTSKLAKTGPESVAAQVWAGAGLVTIGGAVVAVSVIRRRNAGSI